MVKLFEELQCGEDIIQAFRESKHVYTTNRHYKTVKEILSLQMDEKMKNLGDQGRINIDNNQEISQFLIGVDNYAGVWDSDDHSPLGNYSVLAAPYGKYLIEQNMTLDWMTNAIMNLSINGSQATFQTATLANNVDVKEILQKLRDEFSINFFHLNILSTMILEEFFTACKNECSRQKVCPLTVKNHIIKHLLKFKNMFIELEISSEDNQYDNEIHSSIMSDDLERIGHFSENEERT